MNSENLTIKELLEKYPTGFSVTPSGMIQKTIFASSRFVAIAQNYPVAPANGGYLVVEMVEDDSEKKD